LSDEVASPCIGVCALDENDLCLGCYRTVQEITDWWRLDADGRRAVIDACNRRRVDAGWTL
jgi:predicted Fe-S protein YdhL (DUF1289 family)